jgi:hypothetical protein
MPDFTPDDIDIEPGEFVYACNTREIKELIESLVENGHLPSHVIDSEGNVKTPKRGVMELEFIENLEKLKEKYYSLTLDEEQTIQEIFKKHL